jgi:signal transduction histidine kinase
MLTHYITNTILLVLLCSLILLLLYNIHYQKRTLTQQHRIQVLQACRMEQENTLQSISDELHDSITQRLHLLRSMGGTIRNEATLPQQKERIVFSNNILEALIIDIQHIRNTICSPAAVDINLHQAINQELNNINALGSIKAICQFNGVARKLPNNVCLQLIRLLREALQNTLKHAKANKITVILDYQSHGLSFNINDNGRGFKYPTQHNNHIQEQPHTGLERMKKRAQAMGAQLHISTQPLQNTSITIFQPYI